MYSESGGAVGSSIMRMLRLISGEATLCVFLGLAVCGFFVMGETRVLLRSRIVGIVLLWITAAAFLHLNLESTQLGQGLEAAFAGKGGGLVGGVTVTALTKAVGLSGSVVVLAILGLISLLLIFNRSLVQFCRRLGTGVTALTSGLVGRIQKFGQAAFGKPTAQGAERATSPERTWQDRPNQQTSAELSAERLAPAADRERNWPVEFVTDGRTIRESPQRVVPGLEKEWPSWGGVEKIKVEDLKAENPGTENPEHRYELPAASGLGLTHVASDRSDQQGEAVQIKPAEGKASEVAAGGLENGRKLNFSTPLSRRSLRGGAYKLPGLDLLHKPMKTRNQRVSKSLTDNVKLLEETLASFGVTVKVVRVTQGPAITRFEIQPAPGIKVSRITSLADDIALALAASDIRIEAPIPGKSVVGIEVPNLEISPVHFREVLETPEYRSIPGKMTLAVGKDISGNPIVADLSRMPHLLIAGATGSGKSVCLNSLICSILYKAGPDEVKMLLIDPKMVELVNYNGVPHLIAPVVVDPQKAAGTLKWVVTEMESRYELFASAGVRDIVRYNYLMAEQKNGLPQANRQGDREEVKTTSTEQQPENTGQALPYVVVVIDELADLMMVAPADVEDAVCRLAQMARAAGIHLIVATQRPSVDVITGLIKANIPSRIAFAVSSQVDSRTILDMGGAEKLLGRGDMLYSVMGINKPIRVQGCFLDDQEVKNIVDFWKDQAVPEYLEIPESELKAPRTEDPEDELLHKAAQTIIEANTASVSYLQRRLKIGYTRAARLMDSLEERGVVGKPDGAKPREILMTRGVYEQRFGKWGDI